MAIFNGTFFSSTLQTEINLSVILPHDRPSQEKTGPCRVLYLLHGLGENCYSWMRYTSLETFVRNRNLAVVMPEGQGSFYTDMVYGLPWFSYLSEELPALCKSMFNVSHRREDTYIAGLSMGGYGALKCAFTHPELFAGCASFSAPVYTRNVALAREKNIKPILNQLHLYQAIYGTDLHVSDENDLYALAKLLADRPAPEHPRLFLTCGQQDYMYRDNLDFREYLNGLGISCRWTDWPGGHDWVFWDESIRKALDFFFDEPGESQDVAERN